MSVFLVTETRGTCRLSLIGRGSSVRAAFQVAVSRWRRARISTGGAMTLHSLRNDVLGVYWQPEAARLRAAGFREAFLRGLLLRMSGYTASWRVLLLFSLLFVGKPQSAS